MVMVPALLCACVEEEQVDTAREGCFSLHLREAIALNLERRPLYSALTDGSSEPVTDALVQSEQLSLYFAERVDEAARPFVDQGIGVSCDEFVSMSLAPAFRDHAEFEPEPLSSYVPSDNTVIRDDLRAAYAQGGFGALSASATAHLDALGTPRAYHCMTRHVLESLIRIANLAPVHQAHADSLGAGSTTAISDELAGLHLLALEQASGLDDLAAPIQAQGIPIICQDVPHVPPNP